MSMICMVVVAFVTMAMVVVLSAFNGIESLIDDRYSYFDADLTVRPIHDKVILENALPIAAIKELESVKSANRVIEERVFARYESNQRIAIVKGVEPEFLDVVGMDTVMIDGMAAFDIEGAPAALLGIGVKYDLDLRMFEQVFNPLRLSAVLRGKNLRKNMDQALNTRPIPVAGIFSINIDFDSDYVLVPLSFAGDLLGYSDEFSGLEIRTHDKESIEETAEAVQALVGDDYRVETRFEKNALIFKTNKTEKWATFMIMGFIMLIATFNIIAALTLLINEKKQDIKVLTTMGATPAMIKRIFLIEGALINFLGAAIGIGLGFLFVYFQDTYGLIKLEGGLVDYYPVAIDGTDLIAIFGLVVVCGIISSIAPVQIFTRKYASN